LALLVGRGVLDPAPAVAIAAVVLLLVVGPALAARLDRPRGRWPRWALGLALLIVGALVVLSAPAALALLRARADTTAAADAATAGLAAARRGDAVASKAAFSEAERRFTQARLRLTDPVASLGLQMPVLGPNLRAARDLTAVGIRLSRAGRQLSSTADPEQLRIVDATVNLAELERLRPEFESTARTLSAARRQVADIDTTFLIAPVEDAITKLDRRLARAARDSRTAAIASRVLPGVLGGEGPRRYFLAVRNNAEARATGGFLGNWGTITAANGRLDLGDFERGPLLNPQSFEAPRTVTAPADYLGRYERFRVDRQIQNASVSPDVPTVSAVETGLLSQSVVGAVDGVVNIDPVGLASVLEVTGPIEVPGWPEPISADNVVDISLRDSYIRFADDNDAREEFIGDVADAAWEAFSNRDLGSPANLVKALSKATRNKHLTLWFADPAAQRLAERARADGAVPRRPTDLMLLTTQNAGGNKIDTFLRRRVDYSVDLTPSPDGKRVIANARFVATLQNTAPATGYPPYIIGPNSPLFQAGENYTFLTAYSELPLTRATLDGQVTDLRAEPELGRWAYSNNFSLLTESTKTLDLALDGKLQLGADGTYELALVRQPTVVPDTVAVTVRLPEGWRFGAADNVRISADGRTARFSGPLDRDRILRMQIEQDRGAGLWARLQDGR
ncbi:MAG: DUF4012 domain-containing protein, partial [Acidimicrobiia bacterium]|nr:DUF4012 domain-containing protein [Acidimicrobiia bacterium]